MHIKDKLKNKFFYVLLLEIVIVLFFAIRCFGKCAVYTLDKEKLVAMSDGRLTYFDDGAIGMEGQGADEIEIVNDLLHLGSGAYDINVMYDSISNYDSVNTDNSAGYIIFYTDNPRVLRANTVYLHDGINHVRSRLWIRMGSGTNPVHLAVRFHGDGKLAIRNIYINEKRAYRVINCLAVILFFVAVDLFYYYFIRRDSTSHNLHKRYVVAGITVTTVFSSITFFSDYLFINWGHDLYFHLSRIISLANAMKEFQIPHRIQFEMLNGYGYASPLYYGEFFLLIPAVLYNFYVPVQTCYQFFVVCVNFTTCVISYWCFEKMSQDDRKAFLGAFVYTLSSYRLTDVMVRAAVGEYTALMFYPLLIYGFWVLYGKEKNEKIYMKEYLPIVISATGIINSHTLSCEMILLFVIPYVLINIKKTLNKNIFVALIKSVIFTVMLNLWFIVPFLQSMAMNIRVADHENLRRIESSGVSLAQIFGIFHTAYGTDIPGGAKGEMPLSLGVAILIGIGVFGVLYIKKEEWEIPYDKKMKTALYCLVFGMAAVFLSSDLCKWDNLINMNKNLARLTGTVQYPWRYLGIAAALFTTMTVCALQIVEDHAGRKKCNGIILAIVAGTVLTEGYFMTEYVDLQDEIKVYSESDVGTMTIMGGEYLLSGTDWELYKDTRAEGGESVKDIAFHYDKKGKYDLTYTNAGNQASYVDLPLHAYENYHAYDESCNELALELGENNTVRVPIPPLSEGSVSLEYKVPLLWRVCEIISCITVCAMILVGTLERKAGTKNGC